MSKPSLAELFEAAPKEAAPSKAPKKKTLKKNVAAESELPPVDNLVQVKPIESIEDLKAFKPDLKRVVDDLFDPSLLSTICPVLTQEGTVVLLCQEAYMRSDHADGVEKLVIESGKRMHSVRRVVTAPTVIMSLLHPQRKNDVALVVAAESNPLKASFLHMVAWGKSHNASDLHLNVHTNRETSEVKFTIDDRYVAPGEFSGTSTSNLLAMINVIWQDVKGGDSPIFDLKRESQGRLLVSVDNQPVMLRWAAMAADAGPSICLRILEPEGKANEATFENLGYLPSQIDSMQRAVKAEGGAVIFAGVVGSGKSTTQSQLMRMIPSTRKVITLEDPVEYIIPGAIQNTVSRDLDGDVNAFTSKLKTAKRMAMHDLLIGEIRDRETGSAFVDLVLSGTNLYTTTHAQRVTTIPDRLSSDAIGVSRDILTIPGVMKLLIYQALLPKLCRCALPFSSLFEHKERGDHWRQYVDRMVRLYDLNPLALKIRNAEGCPVCRDNTEPTSYGYAGRTVVAEMLEPELDDQVLRYMAAGKSIELKHYFASMRRTPYTDPDMTGKTVMECAVYKASIGMLDPRDIEPRTKSYATIELERASEAARSKSVAPGGIRLGKRIMRRRHGY